MMTDNQNDNLTSCHALSGYIVTVALLGAVVSENELCRLLRHYYYFDGGGCCHEKL